MEEVSVQTSHARRKANHRLPLPTMRVTLCHMKSGFVTVRLDAALERELDRLAKRLGRSRSDLVRDALRRQLALARFEEARRRLLPLAESRGFVTDEDVFADVS